MSAVPVPKVDRFRVFDANVAWDVVVIGAGLGGLATAALLSTAGKKVLVLDRHYLPGGNATLFHRPGYTFEVGVHYIGDCGPDGAIPRVLREAGVNFEFLRMDDDFDTLCFADGKRFSYPRGLDAFEARLLAEFPNEARGIHKWVRFLRQMWKLMRAENETWKVVCAAPFALLAIRHIFSTLDQLLDSCTQDPRLRAVLVGPHLDHAVPPSRVSALLHGGLLTHYLIDGGWYPKGGGQALSDALVARIEATGSKVLLLSTVEQILVEKGRAAGVVFHNKHLGKVTVKAKVVVSNSDVKKTFLELLPSDAVPARVRKKVVGYEMAPGLGILYLGVKKEALGEPGKLNTNYWFFPTDDVEQDYAALYRGEFAPEPSVCVTLTSNKDHTNRVAPEGVMSLQVMVPVPSDPQAWGVESFAPGYRKSPAYLAKKQQLRDRMLRTVRGVFPDLEQGIVYEEMATPLTHARYTLSTNGTPYGLASTPKQFNGGRPGPATHLRGLILAGASTRNAHGVVGALLSGREASRAALKQL